MPPTVPIPAWNPEGVIPPADFADPVSPNRAPYPVTLGDVVLRFSTSPERIRILDGLLRYRAALHAIGMTSGFQWIDGSFVEDVETSSRSRPPGDVDVVTFFNLPAGATQAALVAAAPALFPQTAAEHDHIRNTYFVDGYTLHLGSRSERLVDRSAYWYGVWSHQRTTFKWKGFLQVDLSPAEDVLAQSLLTAAPVATP